MEGDDSNGHDCNVVKSDNEGTATISNNLKRKVEDPCGDQDDNLPIELKNMFGPLKCELCNASMNSTLSSFTHYNGKIHRKKVDKYLKEHNISLSLPLKKTKTDFTPTRCEVCKVDLMSEIHSLQHYSGRPHKRKMLTLGPNSTDTSVPVPHDPSGRFGIGVGFITDNNDSNSEDGKQNKTDINSFKNNIHFCNLCSVFTTSAEALAAHKQGTKHQKKLSFEETADKEFLSKFRTPSDNYYCNACNVSSNSGEQFIMHIQSKKHLKTSK